MNPFVEQPSKGSTAFEVVAHGRVNLIGEHTDYNDGFVLPMAIEKAVRIAVRPRDDQRVVLHSDREAGSVTVDLTRPLVPGALVWARYPVGVLAGYRELGWQIPGFDAEITADLPTGGGLSSSAALEVATATAVEALCGASLPLEQKALLCQQAEHAFAGVPCGIMDQFAVTCARAGHALLLDCRSRQIRHVPLDDPSVAILVINSGVRHDLADGAYAARRTECASAARQLRHASLRDVTRGEWEAGRDALPPVERRRATHVLAENDRVLAFVAALERRDWAEAGRLMRASHASLATDYEVSCRELDILCEIASTLPGVFGCRMTGGGFGGCAVALVEATHASEIAAAVRHLYKDATGIDAATFVTQAAGGPSVRTVG